ncbi:putative cysteinyl-tRNA synthetase [Trypanosoma cruzi]|uniref:Putative cysteinyl-tRNA synthetase n=1 Tax=Trypanosoma cruzi TaxID=5693 RepID=A0A2V2WSI9_TRYCR|nr:putative cysteinyl-tRNA synthetase [Trypanosoma cruzi]
MEDYFGYQVVYQMNITDIDDKIIKRARISALLKRFREDFLQGSDMARLVAFTAEAETAAVEALELARIKLSEPLPDKTPSRIKAEREEKQMELALKESQLQKTRERIASATASGNFDELFNAASGINGDLLDEREGQYVTDQSIFEDHARLYERLFFEDMRRLGVRDPDVVSRVTEYVPQVVDFIQKIMDNGFAYRGTSSIFFDTTAFLRAGHDYPKLKPVSESGENDATEAEMAEGEGALTVGVAGEKRNANDFALWKFSKPGEPRWPSPWGEGRPGWHIECSVMASDILGTNIDVHSGGWDLKFPHHDNECAQSEACHMQHQWINYFLHCGHLHIKGLKMSKSLKNFITIRQALDELDVTPRVMRLLFLANHWGKPMNFSDQSIEEAKERERVLRAFFGSAILSYGRTTGARRRA